MKTYKWIIFLLLLSIASYFREMLFLGVNEIINNDFDYNPYSYQPNFLKAKSLGYLIKVKFSMTAGFSILFAVLTILGLRISFSSKFPSKFAMFTYLFLFILGGLIAVITKLLGGFDIFYPFLRELIGYIHNPLIFILISVAILATNSLKDYK